MENYWTIFFFFFFSLIQDLTGPTILSKPHCQQIKSTVLPGTSEWKGRTVMLSLWELNASKIPSQRTALPHFQTTECQQGEEHLRSRLLTWMETSHEEMTSTWKKLQLSAVFCTYTVNSNSTEKYEWGKNITQFAVHVHFTALWNEKFYCSPGSQDILVLQANPYPCTLHSYVAHQKLWESSIKIPPQEICVRLKA